MHKFSTSGIVLALIYREKSLLIEKNTNNNLLKSIFSHENFV